MADSYFGNSGSSASQLLGGSVTGRPADADPTKWYFGPGGAVPPDPPQDTNSSPSPIADAVQQQAPPAPVPPLPAPAPASAPPMPVSMLPGPVMAALGLSPTDEVANKYRYNPPWRPV